MCDSGASTAGIIWREVAIGSERAKLDVPHPRGSCYAYGMAEPPIEITLERLARLERLVKERFDATDKRLDSIETSMGKMVTVLEAHDQRLEGIVARLDRLIDQTVRARTDDTARMSDIERRLSALEERQPPT